VVQYRENVASAKMARPIELSFEMMNGIGPRNRVLDGHGEWCHVVNTVERLRMVAVYICHQG